MQRVNAFYISTHGGELQHTPSNKDTITRRRKKSSVVFQVWRTGSLSVAAELMWGGSQQQRRREHSVIAAVDTHKEKRADREEVG